jgi:acyl carrier protein
MNVQAFPTHLADDDAVRRALIECYAEISGIPRQAVADGYEGGIEFDSILGVELACAMEARFGIVIPEERLTNPTLYKSLGGFSTVVHQSLVERTMARA